MYVLYLPYIYFHIYLYILILNFYRRHYSTEGQRHYGHNQHEKTHMVWTRPKNARRTMAENDAGLGTKQEKKKGKTQKNMEREYTARNGMEEPTTRGLGE